MIAVNLWQRRERIRSINTLARHTSSPQWPSRLLVPLVQSRAFLKELGRWLRCETGEANSTSHLMQRLSVAVQRGNAAVILACIPPN